MLDECLVDFPVCFGLVLLFLLGRGGFSGLRLEIWIFGIFADDLLGEKCIFIKERGRLAFSG